MTLDPFRFKEILRRVQPGDDEFNSLLDEMLWELSGEGAMKRTDILELLSWFYDAFHQFFIHIDWRWLGDNDRCMDAVQNKFKRLLTLKSYQRRHRPISYLYTINKNICLDMLKKQQREIASSVTLNAFGEEQIDPWDEYRLEDNLAGFWANQKCADIDPRLMEQIQAMLNRLPQLQRQSIYMWALGYTFTEIAAMLNLSYNQVKRRIEDAKTQLRSWGESLSTGSRRQRSTS